MFNYRNNYQTNHFRVAGTLVVMFQKANCQKCIKYCFLWKKMDRLRWYNSIVLNLNIILFWICFGGFFYIVILFIYNLGWQSSFTLNCWSSVFLTIKNIPRFMFCKIKRQIFSKLDRNFALSFRTVGFMYLYYKYLKGHWPSNLCSPIWLKWDVYQNYEKV